MNAPVPPPGDAEPTAVISAITALGAFFALEETGAAPPAGWQPMSAALLGDRVTGVRQWLAAAGGQPAGAVEPRVAASVAHLGLAARLVSPALAAAVLFGRPLLFALHEVRWQPVLGGPVPLALPAGALGAPWPAWKRSPACWRHGCWPARWRNWQPSSARSGSPGTSCAATPPRR